MANRSLRTWKLILQRAPQSALVLLLVTALAFWLLNAAGGDVLTQLRSAPYVTSATIKHFERIYGLDQKLHVRYVRWLTDAAQGDLGQSSQFDQPVATVLWNPILSTTTLAAMAMAMAWAAALGLGILAIRSRGTWVERTLDALTTAASSTPTILLALLALLAAAGASLLTSERSPKLYLLGAAAVAIPFSAVFLSQTRACLSEALKQEHVLSARAKGISFWALLYRHLLRPSMGPMISVTGTSLGALLSGSVIIEQTLQLPGIGSLGVAAVSARDIPLLMGVVMTSATAVLAGNLLADLFLLWNDPRIQT